MRKLLVAAWLGVAVLSRVAAAGEEEPSRASWEKACAFLEQAQAEDGSWGGSTGKSGMTAINLEGLALAPEFVKERMQARMEKAAAYLASEQKEDGSIYDGRAPQNYCTAHAVQALAAYDAKKYAPQIAKAVTFMKGTQADEQRQWNAKDNPGYGGFGYNASTRPDLSNSWIVLDALKAAGVDGKDKVWKEALVFVKRCQNSTEVNDRKAADLGNDGGGRYLPAGDKQEGPKRPGHEERDASVSYGSITFGMVVAYEALGLERKDLPLKTALKWCEKNFDLDQNVNGKKNGQEGLYYYYRAMAKALYNLGEEKVAGHEWAKELAAKLISKQREDGSWVNPADGWSESNPALGTGYALTALALCEKAQAKK